jgi:hypothetical protein
LKELTERVKVLEDNSIEDFVRNQKMITKYENALLEESRMRKKIHQMTVTIKSNDHETKSLKEECEQLKEKCFSLMEKVEYDVHQQNMQRSHFSTLKKHFEEANANVQ